MSVTEGDVRRFANEGNLGDNREKVINHILNETIKNERRESMDVTAARKIVVRLHNSNPGIRLEAAKRVLKSVGFNKRGELTKLRKEGKL